MTNFLKRVAFQSHSLVMSKKKIVKRRQQTGMQFLIKRTRFPSGMVSRAQTAKDAEHVQAALSYQFKDGTPKPLL